MTQQKIYIGKSSREIRDVFIKHIKDSIFVEKQSFNGDEWAGVLNLPDNYSGKAIQINISNVEDERQNKFEKTSIFKTPESIISQFGGTAISEDGSATLLLPQNAVEGDVSLKLLGQNISPDSNKIEFPDGSIILISDLLALSLSTLIEKPNQVI